MSNPQSSIQVHLHAKDLSILEGQTVVFFSKIPTKKDAPAVITEKDVTKVFEGSLADKLITGAASEAVTFREANLNEFRHVIVIGLGSDANCDHEVIRQAGAALIKEIKTAKLEEIFVHLDGLTTSKKDLAKYTQAFVEGMHLCAYNFNELKTAKKENRTTNIHLVSKSGKDKSVIAAFNEGTILASCANFAKRLGDMPGNLMTPTILADSAIAAAKGTSLKVSAWDKKRIEKEKMGGLLGVAAPR